MFNLLRHATIACSYKSDKFLFDSLDALWWNITHTLERNLFMAVTTCQEVSYIYRKAIRPIYERRVECQVYLSNFMAGMKARYSQFSCNTFLYIWKVQSSILSWKEAMYFAIISMTDIQIC